MSRLSIGTIIIGALVAGVLLVAGGQTLASQLALTGDPAALPAIGETASSQPAGAGQLTAELSTTTVPRSLTATIGGQPDYICGQCTPEPIATATPAFVEVSVTPLSSSPTLRPSQAPATRTIVATRRPTQTPGSGTPGGTATVIRPTATGATPTRRPATPTPTRALVSPTALPLTAVATTTSLPAPSRTALVTVTPTPVATPPAPSAAIQLWMSSDFDPAAGIYRSAGDTISWPAGEVLNFAPAVTLVAPASADPALTYRSRVIAWSFVSSGGQSVHSMDVMGHSGCRLRSEPAPGDADGLAGCAYRYLERPTTDAMRLQVHAFWSAGTPLDMCIDVYTYDLGRLRDTDLTLQVAIRTEAIDSVTGQVLASATEIKTAAFAVRLAAPRSAR
jgi:hypothetical protein